MPASRTRGFTLLELMVTCAVVAILAAIALPVYNNSVQRSRVAEGLEMLSSYASRMEQRYQDVGNYGTASCTPSVPTGDKFTLACAITAGGQGYTATVTGSGPMSGYSYSIDQDAVRRTTSHPKGTPSTNCWTIKGVSCDT